MVYFYLHNKKKRKQYDSSDVLYPLVKYERVKIEDNDSLKSGEYDLIEYADPFNINTDIPLVVLASINNDVMKNIQKVEIINKDCWSHVKNNTLLYMIAEKKKSSRPMTCDELQNINHDIWYDVYMKRRNLIRYEDKKNIYKYVKSKVDSDMYIDNINMFISAINNFVYAVYTKRNFDIDINKNDNDDHMYRSYNTSRNYILKKVNTNQNIQNQNIQNQNIQNQNIQNQNISIGNINLNNNLNKYNLIKTAKIFDIGGQANQINNDDILQYDEYNWDAERFLIKYYDHEESCFDKWHCANSI